MPSEIEAQLRREWGEALDATAVPSTDRILDHAAPEHASRRAALAESDEVRRSCAELRGRIEGKACEVMLATRRWTVRDVIAHLASWAMRTRQELEVAVQDTAALEIIHFERDGGPQAWNQRELNARAGRSTGMLFDELDAEWRQVADLVVVAPERLLRDVVELPRTAGDPPARWRMPLIAMVIGGCWHTRYHLERLSREI